MWPKGQTTEEAHTDDCPGDDDGLCKMKKEVDSFTHHIEETIIASIQNYNNKIQVAIHSTSVLPDHYVPNIPTPPPDFS